MTMYNDIHSLIISNQTHCPKPQPFWPPAQEQLSLRMCETSDKDVIQALCRINTSSEAEEWLDDDETMIRDSRLFFIIWFSISTSLSHQSH